MAYNISNLYNPPTTVNTGMNTTTPKMGVTSPANIALNNKLNPSTTSLPLPKATTALKKQTVVHPNGSTTTNEYHPETTSKPLINTTQNQPKSEVTNQVASSTDTLQPLPIIGTNAPVVNTQNQPVNYSGLISNVSNLAQGNLPIGQSARELAEKYGQKIADVGQQGANYQAGALTTGTTPVGEGNAAINAQATAAKETALATGLSAALQGTGQQLTAQNQAVGGLGTAAGLAAPIQVPYSAQLVNPATGESYGGTSGTLNDAVNNVAQQLQSGTIGYDDAKALLAGYGQGGLNALSQWATNNNFNIAQSNTLAAQQGAITPNLNFAEAALGNLKNAMSNLSVWGQGSNIPILGGIANWFSQQSGFGKTQTSTKAGAVGEAQQAIASVLASVKGGTPSDYGSQAKALLPDNPTPADVDAAAANLKALGQQKQAIYSNPGQQTQQFTQTTSTGQGGSIYDF